MISNGNILWSADPDFTVFAQKGIIFRYFFKEIPNFKNYVLECNKKT
jgi:hypothetical protein